MALVTNRRNSAAYARGFIVGGAESWDTVRLNTFRNIYASEAGINDKTGIPSGYGTGGILLPLKPGGMSVYQQAASITATSADAKMGLNMVASSSMVLTLVNAQADQIVALVGSASLAITVTNAALSSAVSAVASSSMAITPNVSLGGIIPTEGSASCVLSPNVTMTALGGMIAVAGGATPLSPEGLSTELLDNQDIETGYSMRESLKLILSALVGKLSGAETTTVTIRDINDSIDRIVATVDANGNRTSVTKDVS